MKRQIKSLLLRTPGFQKICRALTHGHVRVLMYHRFSPEDLRDPNKVDGLSLKRQVEFIARRCTPWVPDQQLDSLDREGRRPACPVVVTVDDGYGDFFEVAYPVFEAHAVPVTLFVVTGFVDRELWFWWDRLRHVLEHAETKQVELPVGGQSVRLDLTHKRGIAGGWMALSDLGVAMDPDSVGRMLRTLESALGTTIPRRPPEVYRALTWDQIGRMDGGVIHFGAHTLTHPILSRIPEPQVRWEVAESRRIVRERTENFVNVFCYPQGRPADYSEATRGAVQEAGFRACYVAHQRLEHPEDPFELPRYGVSSDMIDFLWKICGAERLVLQRRSRDRL